MAGETNGGDRFPGHQPTTVIGHQFPEKPFPPPLVIFTTAYPEYAAEGFELDATDYLVKPFSFERFLKAVNKALEKLERRETGTVSAAASSIFIKSDKKVFKVNLDDILYLEALDDYVKVVTLRGQYLVHDTLKSMLEELPAAAFMRGIKAISLLSIRSYLSRAITCGSGRKMCLSGLLTGRRYLRKLKI